ncbi:MAG TPA: zinc ribbon domain-containing protein [Thermodesulfobacteriaceae bacterium]|nr:zinc ribbon domain-containing protein [Thermodesulfobacteriaceae bacterium]
MPIYEYLCEDCRAVNEVLVFTSMRDIKCPACGSERLTKLMSATSSSTGSSASRLPGHGDTGCCGSRPGEASNCAGPGSCCGKA